MAIFSGGNSMTVSNLAARFDEVEAKRLALVEDVKRATEDRTATIAALTVEVGDL